MAPVDQAEFEALRGAIRARGTARVVLFYVGIAVWGALTVATTTVIVLPVAALLPLLVLAAGFEATAALHIGVDRVDRYIRAVSDDQAGEGNQAKPLDAASAEVTVRNRPGGADPVFSVVYVLAGVTNFVPVALTAQMREEIIAIGAIHALFLWRVLTVRRAVANERES